MQDYLANVTFAPPGPPTLGGFRGRDRGAVKIPSATDFCLKGDIGELCLNLKFFLTRYCQQQYGSLNTLPLQSPFLHQGKTESLWVLAFPLRPLPTHIDEMQSLISLWQSSGEWSYP